MTYKFIHIEGNKKLLYTPKGYLRSSNMFFGPSHDMDEVEWWENRLNKLGREYCLAHNSVVGYIIMCDSVDFVDSGR